MKIIMSTDQCLAIRQQIKAGINNKGIATISRNRRKLFVSLKNKLYHKLCNKKKETGILIDQSSAIWQ